MADYSIYGQPSADWIALAPTLPPLPADQTLDQLVTVTNEGREATSASEMVSQGLADAVTLSDIPVPSRDGSSIEARSYRPKAASPTDKLPIYVNLHGGGFLFGTLASEDAACSRIVATLAAQGFPLMVINVNYRHTPTHVFPTAWHDVEDALVHIHAHAAALGGDSSQLVIGGISAGGQLSASMVLQQHLGLGPLASLPRIRGQVLIIPCLVHPDTYDLQAAKLASPDVSSYVTQRDAPVLNVERIRLFMRLLKAEGVGMDDRRLNVGNATPEEVRGLPPSVFGIAGSDPLRDEGLFYAEMLAKEKVPTDVTVFRGVPHGFRRFGDKLATASKAWDDVTANGIRWCLSNPSAGEFHIKTD